jgi:hypothetical protein
MGRYRVFYAKEPEALAAYSKPYCMDAEQVQTTHIFVREVEADNLDEIFRIQQGENWSPNGEQRDLIWKLGLAHTSMSVADVVQDPDGEYWECRPIGWRNLGKLQAQPA